jgi:hypothetical protein
MRSDLPTTMPSRQSKYAPKSIQIKRPIKGLFVHARTTKTYKVPQPYADAAAASIVNC